jgi:putative DNA primase/helicase
MIEEEHKTLPLTLKQCILERLDFLEYEFPKKEVILDPWLHAKSLTLISGFRGAGKTWFGLGLFDAITTNSKFGPWETKKPVTSLYLEGEMAQPDLQKRWAALHKGNKETVEAPMYLYSEDHVMSESVGSGVSLPRANLADPEWRKYMEEILLEYGVQLFGIDNLASLCPGLDENSKQDWDPINQFLLSLRFKGISIVMFHHLNKAGGQRGTSAREDNVDNSGLLTLPTDYSATEGCRFNIDFSKTRSLTTEEKQRVDPYEFLLRETPEGAIWEHRKVSVCNEEQVLKLLQGGNKQSDIAVELKVSPPTISRIVSKLKREGAWNGKKCTP